MIDDCHAYVISMTMRRHRGAPASREGKREKEKERERERESEGDGGDAAPLRMFVRRDSLFRCSAASSSATSPRK